MYSNVYLDFDLGSSAAVKLDCLTWPDRLYAGTLDVDTDGPALTELTHPAGAADTDDLTGGRLLVTSVLVTMTGAGGTGEAVRVVPEVTM